MKKITVIVDSETGNFGSILNMLKKLGYKAILTKEIAEIENADRIILPGVGAFDNAMTNLNQYGLTEVIRKRARDRIPILGVCLGMQLLGKTSHEGTNSGLGLISTISKKIDVPLRIPHMGWNTIKITRENPLFIGLQEARFYFVHSYFVDALPEDTIATTNYGIEFPCAINNANVWGVQFHPEKSHKFGMVLYKNFMENI